MEVVPVGVTVVVAVFACFLPLRSTATSGGSVVERLAQLGLDRSGSSPLSMSLFQATVPPMPTLPLEAYAFRRQQQQRTRHLSELMQLSSTVAKETPRPHELLIDADTDTEPGLPAIAVTDAS